MKANRQFRFYPTKSQKRELAKLFGCVRWVYNDSLAAKKEAYEKGTKLSYCDLSRRLTEVKKENEFLKEVSAVALQQALRHLECAYKNFFRGGGFPKFKSRHHRQSATFTRSAFVLNGGLKLAKLGSLKVKWSREVSDPSTVTVVKDGDKYFVTLTLEEEFEKLPRNKNAVGIDLGVKTFATLSHGEKLTLPERIKKEERKLKKFQSQMSRCQKGSNNRKKKQKKVKRTHDRIKNIRRDFLQKASTSIIRENQTIAIEDLNVKQLSQIGKRNGGQGWFEFRHMLTYKAEWYGRDLIVVDRFFPSSKTCSGCGKVYDLQLKDRSWTCVCGSKHDRDINAAINILAAGRAVAA